MKNHIRHSFSRLSSASRDKFGINYKNGAEFYRYAKQIYAFEPTFNKRISYETYLRNRRIKNETHVVSLSAFLKWIAEKKDIYWKNYFMKQFLLLQMTQVVDKVTKINAPP